jgi:nucleoid-associated protein YgaU
MRGKRGLDVRTILMLVALAVVATGCAKTMPQEVIDVNRTLGEAKDACASVYAADDLAALQGDVDGMNELADAKKYKKARKAAEPILPEVQQLDSTAASARAKAKADADAAIAAAKAALEQARKAEAETLVASAWGQAKAKMDEATTLAQDPCKYAEAKAAADEAARLAGNAAQAAIAERKRLDEEARRKAEEEARRKAEEEARRLEEERLQKYPPLYTVQRGDSLWRITGMEKIYGNPVYWPIVYDANGNLIQDPNLIYPGQELQIPRGMSDEDMKTKLHTLWGKLGSEGY